MAAARARRPHPLHPRQPVAGLRAMLQAEYPDLSAATIEEALDRAYLAAAALSGGTTIAPASLARLARDRLTITRERGLARRRRAPAGKHLPPAGATL